MNLLKSAAAVSAMTMLSRITGLIRETITARLLGAGAESDAFFIAFRIPNLLRRLFAEGAFSQAFIPILSQTNATQGKSAAVDLARRVSSLLFIVLLLIVVAGVLGGSWVVMGMASGLAQGSEQFELTVLLTQWMFPYILLISMVALASGLLNTFRSFALPAFAPVLLNISFIAGRFAACPYFDQAVKAFAVAVMVGGVLQVAVLWYGLARTDCLINPFAGFGAIKAAWGDEQVRRVLKNMVPATLAVSVAQISLIINTNIASHLEQGSVSWISYGDRLMEFPTALLGVALGTVLLPSLSAAATRSHDEYSRLMDWGLRLTVVLVLPAAVGMGLFSDALVALLFHYGRFDANDVAMTSQAVIAEFGLGWFGVGQNSGTWFLCQTRHSDSRENRDCGCVGYSIDEPVHGALARPCGFAAQHQCWCCVECDGTLLGLAQAWPVHAFKRLGALFDQGVSGCNGHGLCLVAHESAV